MMSKSFSRSAHSRGFTLVEVLVTIAIIAVLAGVLLPALFNQMGRGDTGRLASDLNSLRTGVETFGTDTHRLPKAVDQLITAISTTDQDINNALYTTAITDRWKGPYVNRDVVNATGGGTIQDYFTILTGDNGGRYLSANVTGVTLSDFEQIEAIFDEGNTSSSTSTTSGVIRYIAASSGVVFLMIPLQ